MGRRHNTHFFAWGMVAMLALVIMGRQGCFVQHRPTVIEQRGR